MNYRLFIAAELPDQVRRALAALQERLRADRPPVKWVAPEAMHLTLRFLGDTDAAQVEPLAQAMRAALGGLPPPRLRLARAGAFPSLARPNVLWVGLGGDTAALERLHASLSDALDSLGFAPEMRPFHPHLTLGRVRREADSQQQRRLGERVRSLPAPDDAPWLAGSVTLFRSELRPDGPVYTPLATVRLREAG